MMGAVFAAGAVTGIMCFVIGFLLGSYISSQDDE